MIPNGGISGLSGIAGGGGAPPLTPGTATVTLDDTGEWTPSGVPGANPLLPLVFRVYGNGGKGGVPDTGIGGGGGGGGVLIIGTRATWSAEELFGITIGTSDVPGTSVVGNSVTNSDLSVLAGGGEDASSMFPGAGGTFAQTNGLTSTTVREGGSGASVGGAVGGGGGSGGSISGDGAAAEGDGGASAASADGGDGGNGGDGEVGQDGERPGGGGGGNGDGGPIEFTSLGGMGRIVVLVPTLT